ncbi:MAG: DUF2442 domain-containing protein [Leptospirales bacterium]|nr:DUF2442 domain-containing protein [Leptospirales bacterium]
MNLHRVQSVRPLESFRLDITFDDGKSFCFDASKLLAEGVFQILANPAEFARASVDPVSGCVAWPNGMDLDTQVLYYEDMLGQKLPVKEKGAASLP